MERFGRIIVIDRDKAEREKTDEGGYFSGRTGNKTKKIHREFTKRDAVLYGKDNY